MSSNPGGGRAGGHSRLGCRRWTGEKQRCPGHHCPGPGAVSRRLQVVGTASRHLCHQPFMWPHAADLYQRLLVRRPGDLTSKNKLANLFLALRQIDQAESCFRKSWPLIQTTPKLIWAGRLYLGAPFSPWPKSILTRPTPACLENQEVTVFPGGRASVGFHLVLDAALHHAAKP